jgi:hypothetical protein
MNPQPKIRNISSFYKNFCGTLPDDFIMFYLAILLGYPQNKNKKKNSARGTKYGRESFFPVWAPRM